MSFCISHSGRPRSRKGPQHRRKAMKTLHLSRSLYDELRAHGEEAYPHECCGALLGRPAADGWQVDVLVRASNTRTDAPHNRYEIAPAELVAIVSEARGLGREVAGFYHSHPNHAAEPSVTDFAEAHWIGCAYVITEVSEGKAAATNAFLLAGATEESKRFEPLALEVDDRIASPISR
jgi:proteasome lid subunit RPN8/RPN11